MAILTINQLKAKFERGDFPRQADYWDLIDTMFESGGGSASITVSDTEPATPEVGALWYNSLEARSYIYYDGFWIEIAPSTNGADGATGPQGPSGIISVSSPITNSGTASEAILGIDLSSYYTSTEVNSAIAAIVDSAPATLNTLNELAAALGDDSNYATTVATALSNKQDKVANVSDLEIGYLDGVTSLIQTQINTKASLSGSETLSNKRVNPRSTSITDSATVAINSDGTDFYSITGMAQTTTFSAPSGTPVDGQKITVRIKDNGTARSITWNAIFRGSSDLALPTITVASKTMYLGFIYNSADSKWDMIARLGNF